VPLVAYATVQMQTPAWRNWAMRRCIVTGT